MTDDKPEVERDEDNTDVDANPKLIDLSSDAKKAAKDADHGRIQGRRSHCC